MANGNRRGFIKKVASLSAVAALAETKLFAATNTDQAYIAKEKDLVFLFQGDSITDGQRSRNGDLNNNIGHGYAFSITSRLGADFPDKNLTFFNRGVSGSDINGMADRWQKDALDLDPDVLSILIGINDCSAYLRDQNEKHSIANFEENYRSILDQAKAKNPEILFVLGEIFTLPYTTVEADQTPRARDVIARKNVVKKLATEYNAVFVPYQDVFNKALSRGPEKYWIWDNVHPTFAGHELMTREWLKQVSKRLKFLKKYV